MRRKRIPGRKNSKCKDPGVEMSLAYLRNGKQASKDGVDGEKD